MHTYYFAALDRVRFCSELVYRISRAYSEQAQALPMIFNTISNVEARIIALTLIEKKVAAPLRQSLCDDKESEERVARILAIAMGYAIHRQLLPLKSISAPLAPGTRRWLARNFPRIIAEPL